MALGLGLNLATKLPKIAPFIHSARTGLGAFSNSPAAATIAGNLGRAVAYGPAALQIATGNLGGAAASAGTAALLGGGGRPMLAGGSALLAGYAANQLPAAAAVTGNAFQGLLNTVTGSRREAGKSGLTGERAVREEDLKSLEKLIQNQPELAAKLMPIFAEMRGIDTDNQMKLNQQTAALTGALQQQGIMGSLANTSLGEAGATTRQIMTAPNPYATSAFSYRG